MENLGQAVKNKSPDIESRVIASPKNSKSKVRKSITSNVFLSGGIKFGAAAKLLAVTGPQHKLQEASGQKHRTLGASMEAAAVGSERVNGSV